jgi:hypothetical protein
VAYKVLESRVAQDLGLTDRGDFVRFLDDLPDKVDDVVTSL